MKEQLMGFLMAELPKPFQETGAYIHGRVTSYDSGLELPKTAQIAYINLDTFCESVQNINDELEAWLTFLIKTDIDSIMELVNKYPEFAPIYREIAEVRKDNKGMEETMGFFSKELYEMDREMERMPWL